ncbi:MAG TPA: beta-ketoacyl-ACP synthase II [Miltoncostaeaceae bacterium]|nr:beta-ketoacyl-ACP synthase II [Miltoncostaeaceae bacterium]
MRDAHDRVVITGVGLVSPLGTGRAEAWSAAVAGRSGAGPITQFDARDHGVKIACEARGFDPLDHLDRRTVRRMDRASQLAVTAARLALEDAGLSVDGREERIGTVISTGNGGNASFEQQHRTFLERGADRVSPVTVPMSIANMAGGQVSIELGLRGPMLSVLTACATGLHSIGEAMHMVRSGMADAVLAGGAEAAITPYAVAGLDASKAMSHRNDDPAGASRPFDADRDGFVLGEAGAVLVLERLDQALARGADVLCEVAGYGATSDAYHLTEPAPGGAEQAEALRVALRGAGLEPEQLDYVNAHATSTVAGDVAEIAGIVEALGPEVAARTAVSATKSMHGHCVGATGALETALTALTIAEGVIPPTINLEALDEACAGVDHVANRARRASVRAAACSGFGFGGHNAVLTLTAVEA